MNKKATLIVALSCVYAGAANSVNYDLLGRRGSKMNSPMVYKNVDYTKTEKSQAQLGALPGTRTLAKGISPGLNGNADAITGIFNNRGLERSNGVFPYYMKRYFVQGAPLENWYSSLAGQNGYMATSNQVFIPVPMVHTNPTNVQSGVRTNVSNNSYALTTSNFSFSNPQQPSPYAYAQYGYNPMITYTTFSGVENSAKRYSIWWYDYPSSNEYNWDDVGVYMSTDALPVKLDPSKSVQYSLVSLPGSFTPTPESEMISSRTYNIIKSATKHSVIYVGSSWNVGGYEHLPLFQQHWNPLIYVGIHNRKYGSVDNLIARQYSHEAKAIDNDVYTSRRVDIVAAGNYNIILYHQRIAESLRSGACRTMNGTRFVLVEFVPNADGRNIVSALESIAAGGYTPILAHAERYAYFLKHPKLAISLAEKEIPIQLNVRSVVGKNGKRVKKFCTRLLKEGAAAVIASDAHDPNGADSRLDEGYRLVADKFGPEYANAIFWHMPRVLLGLDQNG